jgi:hypothetical protein
VGTVIIKHYSILYIKAIVVSVYVGSAWKILGVSPYVTFPYVTDSRECLSVWAVPEKFLELP